MGRGVIEGGCEELKEWSPGGEFLIWALESGLPHSGQRGSVSAMRSWLHLEQRQATAVGGLRSIWMILRITKKMKMGRAKMIRKGMIEMMFDVMK